MRPEMQRSIFDICTGSVSLDGLTDQSVCLLPPQQSLPSDPPIFLDSDHYRAFESFRQSFPESCGPDAPRPCVARLSDALVCGPHFSVFDRSGNAIRETWWGRLPIFVDSLDRLYPDRTDELTLEPTVSWKKRSCCSAAPGPRRSTIGS